jgi:hypothetical protein
VIPFLPLRLYCTVLYLNLYRRVRSRIKLRNPFQTSYPSFIRSANLSLSSRLVNYNLFQLVEALQAGRSRVRFSIRSLNFFFPNGRNLCSSTVAMGSTQYQESSWVVKGGRPARKAVLTAI